MATKKKKLAFVIMPFKKERWDVYKYGIKPACEQAGFEAIRVDQLKKGHYNINRKIIEHIFKSDAIVAELSDMNPNVFYEMGVAHAIANKTIMIAQSAGDLPFDIRNYRCIIYEQTVDGLKDLAEEIIESLSSIDEWRNHTSNPVQDFMPKDGFISPEKVQSLQRILTQKDLALGKFQAKLANIQKQLQQKQVEIETLAQKLQKGQAAPKTKARPKPVLRHSAKEKLAAAEAKAMIKKHDFFCAEHDWSKEWCNPEGKGIEHDFEVQHDGKTIIDHATGLMWQQGGSENYMKYADAQKYIDDLNQKRFAGFDDWRLPTLDEAMSLMEPQEQGDLCIDAKFSREQYWIWTADKYSASPWVVGFVHGSCGRNLIVNGGIVVRAVRAGQSIL